jgi:hypothetical protein
MEMGKIIVKLVNSRKILNNLLLNYKRGPRGKYSSIQFFIVSLMVLLVEYILAVSPESMS